MGLIKRFGLIILGTAAVLGIGTYLWTIFPLRVDRETADPAVLALSQDASGTNNYKEGYLAFSDHHLHYVTAGEGEAVVFLHGFPSFWLSFVRQLDRFRGDYRVIAVDGLGAGKSDAMRVRVSLIMVLSKEDLNISFFRCSCLLQCFCCFET